MKATHANRTVTAPHTTHTLTRTTHTAQGSPNRTPTARQTQGHETDHPTDPKSGAHQTPPHATQEAHHQVADSQHPRTTRPEIAPQPLRVYRIHLTTHLSTLRRPLDPQQTHTLWTISPQHNPPPGPRHRHRRHETQRPKPPTRQPAPNPTNQKQHAHHQQPHAASA